MNLDEFKNTVWERGRELFRPMPWRDRTDPYAIVVSELMLQQTQVDRVIPKFTAFMAAFPTIADLARASLADVLVLWSGLGYNRRARFLHETAQKVMADFGGHVPDNLPDLLSLPGVGKNTAGAILAYSFNQAVPFVETNVRTVYFYHLFEDDERVTDAQVYKLVAATVDREHPREWYWALMDYGAYLKRQGAGALTKSHHYKKQAPLKGSLREMRGAIIRALTEGERLVAELEAKIGDERFAPALASLKKDGLIIQSGARVHLP